MEKKRLTASEREKFLWLTMAGEVLVQVRDGLAPRLALIPGGKRDAAMLESVITKLMEKLIDTVPLEQLFTLRRNLQMCNFQIGVRRPGEHRNNRDNGIWMSYDQYNELIEIVRTHCCELCEMDSKMESFAARKGCKVRKIIMALACDDMPDRPDGDCPYYGV